MKPMDLPGSAFLRRAFITWYNGTGYGLVFQHYTSLRADIVDTAGVNHVLDGGGGLVAGVWQHVALTYDRVSGIGRFYVNGILRHSANLGVFTPQTSYDLYLGLVPGGLPYSGALDEISLYTRPLSAEEIFEIYTADDTGKCPLNGNDGPLVFAGPDQTVPSTGVPVQLNGQVSDDGLPLGSTLQIQWSKFDGPGTVTFAS